MLDLSQLSLVWIISGFLASAAVIAIAGTMLAGRADVLADRIGWGEALVGAVLLGGSTSLPGILTSVTTAYQGYPSLSISNAIGGIAVQTAFLAVADLFYRKANLEHAAASVANLFAGLAARRAAGGPARRGGGAGLDLPRHPPRYADHPGRLRLRHPAREARQGGADVVSRA